MQNLTIKITLSTHHFHSFGCLASASVQETHSNDAVNGQKSASECNVIFKPYRMFNIHMYVPYS